MDWTFYQMPLLYVIEEKMAPVVWTEWTESRSLEMLLLSWIGEKWLKDFAKNVINAPILLYNYKMFLLFPFC